ncbi:MAG: glycosyltransferase family 2 protein [Planctomycetota bacterium]
MAQPQKVIAVMPAYNAEKTLERTVRDIPAGSVDEIILVDDCSRDQTVEVARSLNLTTIVHPRNRGYGGNQKTCYTEALKRGADIVVMVHPDYQYDSRVIPFMTGFISANICDVILGSRVRTRRETLDGGMPVYKYFSNRLLTTIENIALGQNLGDFHSGFRAYRRAVLERLPFPSFSDNFLFDTQFLASAVFHGFRIGDVPVPTRYFREASSIDLKNSMRYGSGTLYVMLQFLLRRVGLKRSPIFDGPSAFEVLLGSGQVKQ